MTPYVPPSSMPHAEGQVPDELLEQLHAANERFHRVREARDAVAAGFDMRRQEQLDAAGEDLRQAEREWEDVDRRIRAALRMPPPPAV